jgi:hypothetical protein
MSRTDQTRPLWVRMAFTRAHGQLEHGGPAANTTPPPCANTAKSCRCSPSGPTTTCGYSAIWATKASKPRSPSPTRNRRTPPAPTCSNSSTAPTTPSAPSANAATRCSRPRSKPAQRQSLPLRHRPDHRRSPRHPAHRTPPHHLTQIRYRTSTVVTRKGSLGADLAYLRELVAYWAEEFDWPAEEVALARLPRFHTYVQGWASPSCMPAPTRRPGPPCP